LCFWSGSGPRCSRPEARRSAEAFGCQVNLNYAIPCVIGGKDYGQTFYDLGFSIWYSYLTIPIGLALLGAWAVAALIAFIVHWRKSAAKSAKA
jgi:hypothetical protein